MQILRNIFKLFTIKKPGEQAKKGVASFRLERHDFSGLNRVGLSQV